MCGQSPGRLTGDSSDSRRGISFRKRQAVRLSRVVDLQLEREAGPVWSLDGWVWASGFDLGWGPWAFEKANTDSRTVCSPLAAPVSLGIAKCLSFQAFIDFMS